MSREIYRIYYYVDLSGREHRLRCDLLTEPEGYGVAIWDEGGDREEILSLTPSRDRAEELLELLARNQVTPCALRDVVEDWL
ncbi:MAG: hypothetical protein IJ751_03330 [Oscillospiraceae bacterium]|nr:hypothetical protein [Oscillospiraceae bacterium]